MPDTPPQLATDTRITPGAQRMRESRRRRREGLRCITLDLRATEIDRLIELGHLHTRTSATIRTRSCLRCTCSWMQARLVARIGDLRTATEPRGTEFCHTFTRARVRGDQGVPAKCYSDWHKAYVH